MGATTLETNKPTLVEKIDDMSDVSKMVMASYLAGAATAGIGRGIGGDARFISPSLLPAMDLLQGNLGDPLKIASYLAYGAGVATAYADKVIPKVIGLLEQYTNFF